MSHVEITLKAGGAVRVNGDAVASIVVVDSPVSLDTQRYVDETLTSALRLEGGESIMPEQRAALIKSTTTLMQLANISAEALVDNLLVLLDIDIEPDESELPGGIATCIHCGHERPLNAWCTCPPSQRQREAFERAQRREQQQLQPRDRAAMRADLDAADEDD